MTSFHLQARASEKSGQGETMVGSVRPYLDQFAGGIMYPGLKEIDVCRYVMGYISLLTD